MKAQHLAGFIHIKAQRFSYRAKFNAHIKAMGLNFMPQPGQ